jgi:hypothetical protein
MILINIVGEHLRKLGYLIIVNLFHHPGTINLSKAHSFSLLKNILIALALNQPIDEEYNLIDGM